jgi:streptomycin 6-kinase
MVDIPQYFLHKAARQFGDAGPAWVEALPSILSRCIQQWGLTGCQPIKNLSINLVVYAHSPQYGDVVLKIQGPHTERFTEMTTLALYNGKFACKCHAVDRSLAAMLLERILPGDDLRSLPEKDTQLAVGARILGALPSPVAKAHGLPHYQDWLTNAFARMNRDFNPDQRTRDLMTAAWALFKETDDHSRFLLHGDLHHENILRSQDEGWKVIDPQGVIGPAVFECGRFIENHVIDDRGLDQDSVYKTIHYLAQQLSKSPRSVAVAFFILHLLSICWGHEMNDLPDSLARGFDECAALLAMLPDFSDQQPIP